MPAEQVGLLTSKKSNFVTVYDPLLSKQGTLTGGDSYALDSDISNRYQSISMASYIPPPHLKPAAPTIGTLFYLSQTGALHRQDLAIGSVAPSREHEIWAYELKQRAATMSLEREEHGELDLTKHKKVKMRKRYESKLISASAYQILNML